MTAATPFRSTAAGLLVEVRLTPNAARDALAGTETLADGRSVVLARVRAVPEKGAANKALEKLVAKALRTAPSNVRVTKGLTQRLKTVEIAGDGTALAQSLEQILRSRNGGARER